MQREQNTIGFLSQFGKTLEFFFNWMIFDYPQQKTNYFEYKNGIQQHQTNGMKAYLNTYTQNMLNKKIAYYKSLDYTVYKCLQSNRIAPK